jgi:hypothetical protein
MNLEKFAQAPSPSPSRSRLLMRMSRQGTLPIEIRHLVNCLQSHKDAVTTSGGDVAGTFVLFNSTSSL